MGKTKIDPLKETRLKLFRAHVNKVFNLCMDVYGLSEYQDDYPELIINEDGEAEAMGGEFCFENNEIEINYQGFDDSKQCFEYYTKLITHEYLHYLQDGRLFMVYYSAGHDYKTHPMEVECYSRETELMDKQLIKFETA